MCYSLHAESEPKQMAINLKDGSDIDIPTHTCLSMIVLDGARDMNKLSVAVGMGM